MRVEYGGKVYEFNPDEQRKVSLLDKLAYRIPNRKLKIWLAQQSCKLKGVKVTEVTNDNGRKDLGGS